MLSITSDAVKINANKYICTRTAETSSKILRQGCFSKSNHREFESLSCITVHDPQSVESYKKDDHLVIGT